MTLASLARSRFARSQGPVIEGWVHPSFAGVAESLRQQIAGYGGGGAVCVYHHGECVVDIWGGIKDQGGHAWARDTMSPSYSTTKGVAATLLHILVDQGLLDYDDYVAKYWPEFGQAGKERITIRHVLAHQSGLYHIRRMIDHADRMLNWKHMIEVIERARPIHAPGERTGYHGLTFGFLVGEIAQRVTGEKFSHLVQREIAAPLGLDGFYVGCPDHALSRAAELMAGRIPFGPFIEPTETALARVGAWFSRRAGVVNPITRAIGLDIDVESILDALAPRGITAFDFGCGETLRECLPSANGLFTARSLGRMYAALAGGGEIEGVRIISRKTLARATEPQNFRGRRSVIPFDMRWRLGYHGVATTRGMPRRAFGHFGFGGSGAWAEPNRKLAVALIVNSGVGTPFGDLRIWRIGGAALASADARSPRPAIRAVPSTRRKTEAPRRRRTRPATAAARG